MWLARPAAVFARYPRATAFAAVALLLSWTNFSEPDMTITGDGARYWSLAETYRASGRFSWTTFADPQRGYSFPLALYFVQEAERLTGTKAVVLFRFLSALAGAAALGVALPAFLARVWGAAAPLPQALAFSALCVCYWYGHFLHPLTDFPALLLVTVGLCGLPAGRPAVWKPLWALTAGVCLGLAANVRPINEVALFGACVLAGWHAVRTRTRGAVLATALFLAGAGASVLPQAFLNQRIFGTWNPFAHEPAGFQGASLYFKQLVWGVTLQRYETNVGTEGFPVSVEFVDADGVELLGFDRKRSPLRTAERFHLPPIEYVRLVLGNPVFFASAWARHLFNGLDVAYPSPYVQRLVPRGILAAAWNYAMLSLGAGYALVLLRRGSFRAAASRFAVGAVFLAPAILAVPTAVESRFLLPAWMLLYGLVVFRLFGTRDWAGVLGSRLVQVAVGGGILAGFVLADRTYSHIFGAPASYSRWTLW